MDIGNEVSGGVRKEMVKIKYNHLPNYYTEYKRQGPRHDKGKILHPKLGNKGATYVGEDNNIKENAQRQEKQQQVEKQQMVKRFPNKFLSSGKVVEDPKSWNTLKDNRDRSKHKEKEHVGLWLDED